jgi:hypothetical protein
MIKTISTQDDGIGVVHLFELVPGPSMSGPW